MPYPFSDARKAVPYQIQNEISDREEQHQHAAYNGADFKIPVLAAGLFAHVRFGRAASDSGYIIAAALLQQNEHDGASSGVNARGGLTSFQQR